MLERPIGDATIMCRMPRLLATCAVLALTAFGGAALAADAKPSDVKVVPTTNQPIRITAPSSAPTAPPKPATAQERIEAQRLEPLGRAAFWAREVDIDARDPIAGANLANALRILGRVDEAQAAADKVLIVHPADLDALLEAARARLAQGQGFYAIDFARRAQMVAPKDWRPMTLLAVAFEQSERDDEALAAHRAAVTLAPGEAAPLANLAMFQAGQGDLATAETLLRQAVTLKGAGAPVRLNLALVLGLRGQLAEAEALSRQDLPPDQAASNIAWLREATAKPAAGRSYEGVTKAGS
jgi:Flp pilus assembly protein TadD